MVMKEIPREESAEEKPLLTMTSQVGGARGSEEAADTGRVGGRRGGAEGTHGLRGPSPLLSFPSCPLGSSGAGRACLLEDLAPTAPSASSRARGK